MPKLEIIGFDGVVPRTSPTMLGEHQAQRAFNVKLYSKELRFWYGSTLEDTPSNSGLNTIYKYYNGGTTRWLTFTGDVDIVRSPTDDTTDYRIYYTDGVAPKKTNQTLVNTGSPPYPGSSYEMGVPAPTGAPTLTRVGASVVSPEDRAYVYTYVSTFGSITEESAPSPAATVASIGVGDSVTVNAFTAVPAGDYNITHRRIYRSVAGASSDTYQFVAEIAIGTASYSDALLAAALGEVIPSIGWLPPVADLKGLCSHPSGALVGFSGNTLYFSEPFFPHAWPLKYGQSIPDKIVGIGVYGTSVVVMTDRNPYIIGGVGPSSMSVERVPILEPCVSKRSIASDEFGVVYASRNGLVGIGPTVRGIITGALFAYNEWQQYDPENLAGEIINNQYFGIYPSNPSDLKTMVVNRGEIPALSFIEMDATALHIDSQGGKIYYCDTAGGKIYTWDDDPLRPLMFYWKSKRFVLPQATSFSVLKLDADYDQIGNIEVYNTKVADIAAANAVLFATDLLGALNEVAVNELEVNGDTMLDTPLLADIATAQVLIYCEEELVSTSNLLSFDPVRLLPFKGRIIEIEIVGNMNVTSVAVATTTPELRTTA